MLQLVRCTSPVMLTLTLPDLFSGGNCAVPFLFPSCVKCYVTTFPSSWTSTSQHDFCFFLGGFWVGIKAFSCLRFERFLFCLAPVHVTSHAAHVRLQVCFQLLRCNCPFLLDLCVPINVPTCPSAGSSSSSSFIDNLACRQC